MKRPKIEAERSDKITKGGVEVHFGAWVVMSPDKEVMGTSIHSNIEAWWEAHKRYQKQEPLNYDDLGYWVKHKLGSSGWVQEPGIVMPQDTPQKIASLKLLIVAQRSLLKTVEKKLDAKLKSIVDAFAGVRRR